MSLFLQLIEGCYQAVPDLHPLLPDDPGATTISELMPLVKSPYKFSDTNYYLDSANFYKSVLQDRNMSLVSEIRNFGTAAFTEYRFTFEPDSEEIRRIYTITSGWLFFIHQGQSSPDLLGEAIPDEDLFVLKRFPSTRTVWKKFYPELVPLLGKTVFLNGHPLENSDLDPSDPSIDPDSIPLITQIRKFLNEDFFHRQYKAVMGNNYSGTETWEMAYFHLFLNNAGVAIPVAPDAQIGWTRPDPVNSSSQRLGLLFDIDGWSGNEQRVKDFFTYRARIPGQEGHSMLSLLTETPVEAGYIDYIAPREYVGGRVKNDLNKVEIDLPAYHALAIDPDSDPPTLVVQKAPSSEINAAIRAALQAEQSDHGETRLRLRNPLELPIKLQFPLGLVDVSTEGNPLTPDDQFSDAEKIISFRATPSSPDHITLSVTTTDLNVVILQLQIKFFEFKWNPVRFHLLYDDVRTLEQVRQEINETQIRNVVKEVNYILTRQANVYLVPVENELGIILEELGLPGDLGQPLEWSDDPFSPVGQVNQLIKTIYENKGCHVVIAWTLNAQNSEDAGYVVYDKYAPNFAAIFVNYLYINPVVLHELFHWFSILFHGLEKIVGCKEGAEHFNHDCKLGDTTLYFNLMAPDVNSDGGKFISIRQATDFNENIYNVIPPTQ